MPRAWEVSESFAATRSAFTAPDEEQADVAWHSARKVEDTSGEAETAWLQIAFPAEINFRSFPAQCRGPRRFGDIDCPSTIAAELTWKTQNHEFLLTILRGLPRLMEESTPRLVRDMLLDELANFVALLLGGDATCFVPMNRFLVFEIGDQPLEVGHLYPAFVGLSGRS